MGLSPFEYDPTSDLFVKKLKTQGVIDQAVFSFSIGMDDVQSKITFGGYDLKQFATDKIIWHDILHSTIYWTLILDRMEFQLPKGWTHSVGRGKKIIVDSGTSFILMPKSDIDVFMLNLEQ